MSEFESQFESLRDPFTDSELVAAAHGLAHPVWGEQRQQREAAYFGLAESNFGLTRGEAIGLLAILNSGCQPNPAQLGHG